MRHFQLDLLIPGLDDASKCLAVASHASAPLLECVLIEIVGGDGEGVGVVIGASAAGVLARTIHAGMLSRSDACGMLGVTVSYLRGTLCSIAIEEDGVSDCIDIDGADLFAFVTLLSRLEAEAAQ